MAQRNSTALAVDFRPLPFEIASRVMNTVGVLLFAMMLGTFTFAAEVPALGRSGIGLLIAAIIVVAGDVSIRRFKSDYARWSGTSMVCAGYALAYFIAHSSYYVSGAPALSQPYACWAFQLAVIGAAVLHADRIGMLRWLVLPFSIAASGYVFWSAVHSSDAFSVAGYTLTVPAIACLIAMPWWSMLSAVFKSRQSAFGWNGRSLSDRANYALYFGGEQLCFLLSVGSAVLLPVYLSEPQYAPIWWSGELPLLIALFWRSEDFIKHVMLMVIWTASAAWMLLMPTPLPVVLCLLVPASALGVGLAYRVFESKRPRWQKLAGYIMYIYGAALVGLAVPVLKLGAVPSMPYWLVEAGVLLALGLALRDRLLHMVACLAAACALVLYGTHVHDWQLWLMAWTVAGCYGFCLAYGWVVRQGGLTQSDFAPLPGKYVLFRLEARWLEALAAVIGAACWLTGSLALMHNAPIHLSWSTSEFWLQLVTSNTFLWWPAGLLMIFYGLRHDKLEHRFLGVGSLWLATGKMWAWDMSHATTPGALVLLFVCGAICAFGAARLYWAAFQAYHSTQDNPPSDNDDTPPSGGNDGDATRDGDMNG